MKLHKWWKIFFVLIPLPSLLTAYWESAPKKHREKVKKTLYECQQDLREATQDIKNAIFKPIDEFMDKAFQAHLDANGHKVTAYGVELDLRDFDVELTNSQGLRCARVSSDSLMNREYGTCRPGTYGGLILTTPSIDSLKYIPAYDLRNHVEETTISLRQVKTVMHNDTLRVDLPVALNIDGGSSYDVGNIQLTWECRR